ncbi:phosphate/phosphite/phosphonate ABC transporter substrate-binding protein [Arsukibacterium sp.]|uniref:phosphate/phosphite/phosphonate ABC transporter substrate-binding protein n=1 Tax=Arsukibacterium sp. TaxID=1977258 RepID=UPI002FDB0DBF
MKPFYLMLCLLWLVCQPAQAQVCPATIRFADTGIEGTEELQRAYQLFVERLQQLTGLKVQFFPVGNRSTAVNALRFKQVDIVLAGPTEYILMQQRMPGIAPIAAIIRPEYSSVFIVPADSHLYSLTDLKGKHVAMKDHGSTTGHIMPSYMLHQAGLDLDRDLRISLIDGARMVALANGEVDAVGTGIRDFAPFVAQQTKAYRIIAQGDNMPGDPIIAGAHLPKDCVSLLRQVFMDNADSLLQAILDPGARDKYQTAQLKLVDDADYQQVRDAMRLLKILR